MMDWIKNTPRKTISRANVTQKVSTFGPHMVASTQSVFSIYFLRMRFRSIFNLADSLFFLFQDTKYPSNKLNSPTADSI